ncbi:MAG: asparagine synthetase B, partial [Calditrichaeota bacterium]|nr:asparagine synthetase B [Calditrichota bacterium]
MCGICGIHNPSGADPGELGRMMEAIRHRGPDDEGQYLRGPVALGSRRLSIIDLDSGRMPIANEDGTVRIVFNGEIYNFAFLRRQLIAKGHRFQTRSDTE